MAILLALMATALLAGACRATQPASALGPVPAPGLAATPRGEDGSVELYQYAGSRQCGQGGKSLEALRSELASAGVQVREATCGHDGRMYAQSCGTADGRILVVRVSEAQAAAAARVGLKLLRELPEAVTVACR